MSSARICIGHVVHAFSVGGEERELANIVRYGDGVRCRHVIVALTEVGDFGKDLPQDRCTVVALRKQPGNDWSIPGKLATIFKREQVTVVHARGWATLVETALAAWWARVPIRIYAFHGKTISELSGLSLKRRLLQALAIRLYTRLVTLNRLMQQDLARECWLPRSRIAVIRNGIDSSQFRPKEDRKALRQRYGIPGDQFVVGTVGRLDPVKNHEGLLAAVRQLCDAGHSIYVLIVGEGEHRGVLECEIKRLNLQGHVCLFGFSDRVADLLNCMDAYVQSSWYEGASHTIVEAMACGVPVIASRVGGTSEFFHLSQQDMLFDPHEVAQLTARLLRVMQDKVFRYQYTREIRESALERFSVTAMVGSYEKLYAGEAVDL